MPTRLHSSVYSQFEMNVSYSAQTPMPTRPQPIQSVVLGEQLLDFLINCPRTSQGILLRLTGCHVADEVIGVKKAVHPDDKAEEQQWIDDGGRHQTEYQHHRNRQAALHIAVVHLPCARDTGEDKGQKAVLFMVYSPSEINKNIFIEAHLVDAPGLT